VSLYKLCCVVQYPLWRHEASYIIPQTQQSVRCKVRYPDRVGTFAGMDDSWHSFTSLFSFSMCGFSSPTRLAFQSHAGRFGWRRRNESSDAGAGVTCRGVHLCRIAGGERTNILFLFLHAGARTLRDDWRAGVYQRLPRIERCATGGARLAQTISKRMMAFNLSAIASPFRCKCKLSNTVTMMLVEPLMKSKSIEEPNSRSVSRL
jgi:hypothetical protein